MYVYRPQKRKSKEWEYFVVFLVSILAAVIVYVLFAHQSKSLQMGKARSVLGQGRQIPVIEQSRFCDLPSKRAEVNQVIDETRSRISARLQSGQDIY